MLANSIDNNGKFILVFDNVFDLSDRFDIYNFVRRSQFCIGWQDTDLLERRSCVYLHSKYSQDDMTSLDFFKRLKNQHLTHLINDLEWKDTTVNLSFPTNTHFSHTHNDISCLYYVNTDWKEEWAGETLFYNESGDVVFCSTYKPGRIILFDGTIPHTIRPQSIAAPDFRFTLATRFYKNDAWLNRLTEMLNT